MKKLFIVFCFIAASSSYALAGDGLVRINGGAFMMGSPVEEQGRGGNEIQRQITVSSFFMGKHEVTQAEYQELTGTNPSYFKGPNLPVENVSWFDAVEYCNKLSEKEGLSAAYAIDKSKSDPNNRNSGDPVRWVVTWNRGANGYRLPTEAEWEYACRAGTTTPFNTGSNITGSQVNYDGSRPYDSGAKDLYRQETTPVGSFPPNLFGLCDMHGNVGEWCWDWNGEYRKEAEANPTGAPSGLYRVFRGGSWNSSGQFVRSACRSGLNPSGRGYYLGFRLARNAP